MLDFTKCTGTCFEAPPWLEITAGTWFEAAPVVLRRRFLTSGVRSAHIFPLHDPALPFPTVAKSRTVLAREAQNGLLMDSNYVPGVLWCFRGAPNHAPVHPAKSRNAQAHGFEHPLTSKMRQAHALEPIVGTIAVLLAFSCEECLHLRPALSGHISAVRDENVSTPRTRDKK